MMPPAELSDVVDSFERPLTSDEARVVPNWLARAWRIVLREVPAVETRLALAEDAPTRLSTDDVTDVLVAMVERKLRNPEGLRSYDVDDYSQTVDSYLSTGRLYLTDEERSALMPAIIVPESGMYSIPLGR